MSDNPFLLPPGGTKPPVAPPVAPPVSRPAVPDPAHYIALPASVESATHRIVRAPADEAIAEETRVAAPAPDAEVAPARPTELRLILPDGAGVRLAGALLFGRDPAAIPERPDARLLPVSDPGKTVSKTHALLEPDPAGGSVRVVDLFSTNGVAVDSPEGRTLVAPGGSARARVGSSILLGSFVIEVAAVDPDHA